METGVVIAIVVVAIVVVAVVALLPRMKGLRQQRELKQQRSEIAGRHRSEAQARESKAELAEQTARRERAEAELHETRAKLHDEGLADDELRDEQGNEQRAERNRRQEGDGPGLG